MITPPVPMVINPITPRYKWASTALSAASFMSLTRASNAWCFDSTGTLTQYSSNVYRFDYGYGSTTLIGLLLEGARTNSIRNNSFSGTSTGTPGTLPTNTSVSLGSGLSQQIVASSTKNGVPYIQFRITGTTSGTNQAFVFNYDIGTTTASAAQNQPWALSSYLDISAGSLSSAVVSQIIYEYNSGGSLITSGSSTSYTLTSSFSRYTFVRSLSNASTTYVGGSLSINFPSSGTVVDFTIDIGAPQLEKLSGASQTSSSPILTTGSSSVTRDSDALLISGSAASLMEASAGTVLIEMILTQAGSGSNQFVFADSGYFPIFISTGGLLATSNISDPTLPTSPSPSTLTTSGTRMALGWNTSGRSITGTNTSLASDSYLKISSSSPYIGSSYQALDPTVSCFGWFKTVSIWDTRLSDTMLIAKVKLGAPL